MSSGSKVLFHATLIYAIAFPAIIIPSIKADCDVDTNLRAFGIDVFEITDVGYDDAKEQYGETVVDFADEIAPTIIAFATDASEVQTIVNFVNGCDDITEITVRSGGHQYSGLSSCNDANTGCLQLDVSGIKTFQVLDTDYGVGNNYNENINNNAVFNTLTNRGLVKVGAGLSYEELYGIAAGVGINIIGGICIDVFVGGNYQSSGHSTYTKTFGTGMDWIKSFDIVLSDGTLMTIDPSDPSATDFEKELAWAVKGGSPGAFGVVISYDVEVFFDSNLPQSAQHITYWVYTPNTMKALLTELNQLWVDPDYKDSLDWGGSVAIISTIYDDVPEQITLAGQALGFEQVILFSMTYSGIETGTNMTDNIIYQTYIAGRITNPLYNPLFTPLVTRDFDFPPSQRNFFLSFDWEYWNNGFRAQFSSQDTFDLDWYFSWIDGITGLMLEGYYIIATTYVYQSSFGDNDPNNVYTSHPYRDTKIFLDTWSRVRPNQTNTDSLSANAQTKLDLVFDTASQYLPEIDRNKRWIAYTWGETDIEQVWPFYYDSEENYQRLRIMKYLVDPDDLFNTPFTVNPLNPDDITSRPTASPVEEV